MAGGAVGSDVGEVVAMKEPTVPEFPIDGPKSEGWRSLLHDIHWSLYNTWRSLSRRLAQRS